MGWIFQLKKKLFPNVWINIGGYQQAKRPLNESLSYHLKAMYPNIKYIRAPVSSRVELHYFFCWARWAVLKVYVGLSWEASITCNNFFKTMKTAVHAALCENTILHTDFKLFIILSLTHCLLRDQNRSWKYVPLFVLC